MCDIPSWPAEEFSKDNLKVELEMSIDSINPDSEEILTGAQPAEEPLYLTYEEAFAVLEKSEVLVTSPRTITVQMDNAWNDNLDEVGQDEPVAVTITTSVGAEITPTLSTFLALCGGLKIARSLASDSPASLIQPIANYWLSTIEDDSHGPRFAVTSAGVAKGIVRGAGLLPFSATELAGMVESEIKNQCDAEQEIFFVPDIAADFNYVVFRAYTNEGAVEFADADGVVQVWTGGIQFAFSPIGNAVPTLSPILVNEAERLVLVLPGADQKYSVRKHGKDEDGVATWLEESVGTLLLDLPFELERLAKAVQSDVSADLTNIVFDVVDAIGIPNSLKQTVVDEIVNSDAEDAYALVEVIANMVNAKGADYELPIREKIQRAAGQVLSVLGDRCPACHNLKHK